MRSPSAAAPPPTAMASRGGRPKKRIDAAFDALIPLGFSKDVVRKTIKNLLKVYGGDDGWVFIEEANYKLVIDTILEQQEEEEKMMEKEGEDVDSSRAMEISESVVDAGERSLRPEVRTNGLHFGDGDGCEDELPALTGDDSPSILFAATSGHASPNILPVGMAGDASLGSLQLPNEVPRQRRPPCYGWISESESEEEEEEA